MIKIYFKEIGLEFVGWIHLTQNREFSLTLLNNVMNSRRMRNVGCLADQTTKFWRGTARGVT